MLLRKAKPILIVAAVAGALRLLVPASVVNYDTVYQLVWGSELARGHAPDYNVPLPPTPHPLVIAWGALVAPFGAEGAWDATVALSFVVLGAIVYLVFRLGELWFEWGVGVAAALVVVTRLEIPHTGLQAYVDLPYLALLLAAVATESKRRRAGWPVLAWLAAAGLIRPEAWLFSLLYVAYLAADPALRSLRRLAPLAAFAISAPLAWAAFDLAVTGDPRYSLTRTRTTTTALEHDTGIQKVFTAGPHVLAHVLQPVGIAAAAVGLVLALTLLRRRALLGTAVVVIAGAAFVLLGIAGLPLLFRFALPASALLSVFCGVALGGWRLLAPGDRWRPRWQAVALVLVALFVVDVSHQLHFARTDRVDLEAEAVVDRDFATLLRTSVESSCGPIAVPNHRGIPNVALWRRAEPSSVVSVEDDGPAPQGYLFQPTSAPAQRHFATVAATPGFTPATVGRSFRLLARCD